MAAHRLSAFTAPAAVLGATSVLGLGLIACGEKDEPRGEVPSPLENEQTKRTVENFAQQRREGILKAVRQGELPPAARGLIEPDGTLTQNFVDGPRGNQDIVRTRDGGDAGPKLRWDLDQSGRIDPDEREITDAELYAATGPYLPETPEQGQ